MANKTSQRQIVAWSAPEFRYYEKAGNWSVVSAAIAALVIIFAFWQGNFLFVVFTVIGEVLILFWAKQKPREISYELSDAGVTIVGKKQYRFNEFSGHSLIEALGGPEYYELILHPTRPLSGVVRMLVPNTEAELVKERVSEFLPEVDYQISITEHLWHWIGF